MTSVTDLSSQVKSFEVGAVDFKSTWGVLASSRVIFLERSDSQVYSLVVLVPSAVMVSLWC